MQFLDYLQKKSKSKFPYLPLSPTRATPQTASYLL